MSRVFNHRVYKEKVRYMLRRCSKEGWQAITSIWAEVVFRLE
jgi:hypothetical protein